MADLLDLFNDNADSSAILKKIRRQARDDKQEAERKRGIECATALIEVSRHRSHPFVSSRVEELAAFGHHVGRVRTPEVKKLESLAFTLRIRVLTQQFPQQPGRLLAIGRLRQSRIL